MTLDELKTGDIITLTTNHEDIANGIQMDTDACPLALAAKRLFPDCTSVTAYDRMFLNKPGLHVELIDRGEMPKNGGIYYGSLRRYARQFDDTGMVDPDTFELKVVRISDREL